MASPCLATAGASLGDIWTMAEFPFAVALWAAVATLGPALGPTLSSYAVKDLGWRFSSWELLIIAGPVYLAILLVLPESSGPTILYYKAKRMREDTGNQELMSASERKQRDMKVSSLLFDALVKPWEINALDPAILFTTVYMGLCYGIYYSFFEVSTHLGQIINNTADMYILVFTSRLSRLLRLQCRVHRPHLPLHPSSLSFRLCCACAIPQVPRFPTPHEWDVRRTREPSMARYGRQSRHRSGTVHLRMGVQTLGPLDGAHHWPQSYMFWHLLHRSECPAIHSQHLPDIRSQHLQRQ
jgi:hypothetical protein